jgi:hypothetical protein
MYIIRYEHKGKRKKSAPVDAKLLKDVLHAASKARMPIISVSFQLKFGNEVKEILLSPPLEKIEL